MNDNYKTQNNKGQVELNPVQYKNVRLKQPLGPFAEGDSFAVATVENYRGQVRGPGARAPCSVGVRVLAARSCVPVSRGPSLNGTRGQVMLYKTETDFLNGEASFADKEFRVPSKRRFNNKFYIHELLAFLQRGHSLLEPTCRCKHEMGPVWPGALRCPRLFPAQAFLLPCAVYSRPFCPSLTCAFPVLLHAHVCSPGLLFSLQP